MPSIFEKPNLVFQHEWRRLGFGVFTPAFGAEGERASRFLSPPRGACGFPVLGESALKPPQHGSRS
jgi:hypothetical protein